MLHVSSFLFVVLLILWKVCFFVLVLTSIILYNFLSPLLLLIKSVGYYLWAIMKKIINYVTIVCDFHLAGTLSCWHFLCHLPIYSLWSMEKAVARNLRRPPANSSWGADVSFQQPRRKWILPTAMWVIWEVAPSQLSLEMTVACETQSQGIQLKFSTVFWCAWIPDLQELWVCSKGCFLTFLTLTDLIRDW